ncbi:MAG: FadR/GntR family transcriptional regulator [Janthinobacterium lividum]
MTILTVTANRRLYQAIATAILDLIASGEFPPGATLPAERELATRLGVSRSTVREAVIALEVLGFLDVRVGSGVVVLPKAASLPADPELRVGLAAMPRVGPDPELPVLLNLDVEIPPFSMLQARLLIEPETASLAAQVAGREERTAIEAAWHQNVADNAAGSTTHPGDRLFHIRIAQASGNAAYEMTMMLLLGHRYGYMFQRLQRLYTPFDMPGRSEREHEAILSAILDRDAGAARETMRQHINAVIRIFSRDFKDT